MTSCPPARSLAAPSRRITRRLGVPSTVLPSVVTDRLVAAPLLLALLLAATSLPAVPAAAQPPAELLPETASYDPAVPRPEEVLGWEVGEWHVRHDQLVEYVRRLAESSDRVLLEEQEERTHEGRPLLLLTISSPANLARIDEIRRRHRELSEPPYRSPDRGVLASMPVVVWLGYSIHGDEASGSNAALLVAWHLAAARGGEAERLLEDAVVLLDPSLNPDGLARFAQWANMHRGAVPVADPESREHRQGWPSGRMNHYWFDLNRDWLPLRHPESRARVATFQRWRPNVAADFHEMGSDATYFFQPGVPSRQNPLTPAATLDLTHEIARYHAEAFDRAGRLYYSEETFDDFYYGKGSTYPDVQGSVGILFEQASARGQRHDTDDGVLTFADAIGGHVLTSFSTLRAAVANREQLLAHQAEFFRRAVADAGRSPTAGWVAGDGGDPARAVEMLALLRAHGIEVHRLARRVRAGGHVFEPGRAWVVPAAQRQALLAEALFERRTEFADDTFYDVSSWTLPLAFDLPYAELELRGGGEPVRGGRIDALEPYVGERVGEPALPPGRRPTTAGDPYAWVFEWSGYWAPRALRRLQEAGARARVATRPFEAETDAGRRRFGYGAIVVPRGSQEVEPAELARVWDAISVEDGVDVYALASGLTAGGVDLGSPSLRPLEPPRPLLVVGDGVSPYEAGEVWHLLDRRFGVALPLVERDRLERVDLDDYSHVFLVGGRYGGLGESTTEALRGWLRRGGVLVASGGAAFWAGPALVAAQEGTGEGGGQRTGSSAASGGAATAAQPTPEDAEPAPEPATQPAADREPPAYADAERIAATALVSGAIFETRLDVTHPIAFGYGDPLLPVFRESSEVLEPSDNPYENVALYTETPRLAGYASDANVEKIAGTAAVLASRVDRGTAVRIADDPVFRAFWLGPSKLLLNALYFGLTVKRTEPPPEGWR